MTYIVSGGVDYSTVSNVLLGQYNAIDLTELGLLKLANSN